MNAARELWLRSLRWTLLGCWIGGWTLFAVVARIAFHVLPSTRVAGQLVGPLLTVLHLYGAAAGAVLAAIAWASGRNRLLVWMPLALAALCLASQLGVTPRIEAIRDLAFGPDGSQEVALRFQQLHRLSMAIYTTVGLGAYALVWIHVRVDLAPGRG